MINDAKNCQKINRFFSFSFLMPAGRLSDASSVQSSIGSPSTSFVSSFNRNGNKSISNNVHNQSNNHLQPIHHYHSHHLNQHQHSLPVNENASFSNQCNECLTPSHQNHNNHHQVASGNESHLIAINGDSGLILLPALPEQSE